MLARGLGRKKALGSCNMEWFCLVASVWRRSPLFSGLFSERPAVSAALPSRSAAVFRRRSSLFSVGLSHTGEAFFPLRSQKNLLLTSLSHSLSLRCVTAWTIPHAASSPASARPLEPLPRGFLPNEEINTDNSRLFVKDLGDYINAASEGLYLFSLAVVFRSVCMLTRP